MKIPDEIYSYVYEADKLTTGCSLGNTEEYVCLDRHSNLQSVWCLENEHYLGKLDIDFKVDGARLEPHSTTFAPAYQYTDYPGDKVNIKKLAFIPYGAGYLRAAYIILLINNESENPREVEIHVKARYSGISSNISCKCIDFPDKEEVVEAKQENEIFIASNSSLPYWTGLKGKVNKTRILGSSYMPEKHIFTNPSRSDAYYRVVAAGKSTLEFPVFYVVSPDGEKAALDAYKTAKAYNGVFERTVDNLKKNRTTCDVVTPNPVINRGIFWSKVNTVRVEHRYPLGFGFTNMPPYDIVVVRDSSWFSMGNNYLDPSFSEELLNLLNRYCQYDSGKMTEYIKLSKYPVTIDDYGITLNDCTPMFVTAVYKHYCITHNEAFLKEYYPVVEKCADYILTQIRDGLVYAETPGTSCYGVVGWRNVLSADHINGFVPELNAECVYALRLTAELADRMGYCEKAGHYGKQAELLKENINKKLVSEKTGLYYLEIDQWGNKRHDITADMMVPVMLDVAPPELKSGILELMTSPQFWTPFGVRTIGNGQPEYDPDYIEPSGQTLHGGIWPNLAGWVAYGGRREKPGLVAEALHNIYSISEVDNPAKYNSVCPGEFPECLNGDTFVSNGMKASPWTPPSYLWLAMEGLIGFEPRTRGLAVNPSLPDGWNWLAAKDVMFGKEKVSLFYWKCSIYTNRETFSDLPIEVFEEQLECDCSARIFIIAFKKKGKAVVFAYAYEDAECGIALSSRISGWSGNVNIVMKAGEADLYELVF